MKIFFDHITGKLTNYDLVYSLALATFEEKEYSYALENGWIPLSWYYEKLNEMTWINARGCRLVLSKFTFSKKQRKILNTKDITVKIFDKLDDNLRNIVSDIYIKYIKHKDYYEKGNEENSEILIRDDPIDWKYFIYYYKDTPVAFTELIEFADEHVLTGQFAWDYNNPKLSLGTYATLFEIKWAIEKGYKKYHLSYAYEESSMYKSRFDGFEFWNGRKWLTDTDMYVQLCKEDSKINSLISLNKYQEKYFKIIKEN